MATLRSRRAFRSRRLPALVLAATALHAGCAEAPLSDGPLAAQLVATTEATVFSPGIISDARWQYRITFTPDGRTAYFTVAEAFFPASRSSSIYVSHMENDGSWSTPVIAPFSGTYTDIDPFITPNGQRLYFSSIRPLNGTPKPDLDLFYMERSPHGWSEPVRLGPEVNTALDELYASLDAKGNLYFASGPFGPTPAANWNIYTARVTRAGFEPREPVAAVNTRREWNPADPTWDWEFNPEISVDGRTLLFASLRPGGYGYGDLYVSHYHRGEWSAPVNLGPAVNTIHDEFHPTLSRDGRTLYFARTVFSPVFVPSDFYSVPTSALDGFRR